MERVTENPWKRAKRNGKYECAFGALEKTIVENP